MRVLALFLALVDAQVLFSFSGNFSTQRQKITANELDYYGTCSNGHLNLYTIFNYTFTTPGVRGVYGANLLYVGVTQDLSGFTPNNLCNPLVYPLKQTAVGFSSGTGPEYTFGGYFEAATYYFVIGGDDGPFAGEIKETQFKGQTSTANLWSPFYTTNDIPNACTNSGSDSYFDTQVFTVNDTGLHMFFLVLAQNSTGANGYQIPSGYPSLTILRGDYRANVSTIRCADVGSDYVKGSASTTGSLNIQVYNVWLKAGVTYTYIVSGGDVSAGDGYVGHYGIAITGGTRYNFSATNDVFIRPDSRSCVNPRECVAAYQEAGNNYGRMTFSVPKNSFYWVNTVGSTRMQWYFYNEFNLNKATCGSSFNCVNVGYFIPGYFYFSGDSDSFTIYCTGLIDQSVYAEGYFDIYVQTGVPLTPSGRSLQTNSASRAPPCLAVLFLAFAALWA